jgi:Ca2+:H+ antiporter
MTTLDAIRATAAEQAAALGSAFIGSEHLFLAWLLVGDGPAHAATLAAGLTADSFRTLLGARTGPPARGAAVEAGGLSSHAQRVITTAEEMTRADGRDSANADDVLLALIREPRGAVARALSEAKVKPSHLKMLTRPHAPGQSSAARREGTPGAPEVARAPRERKEPAPPKERKEPQPARERPVQAAKPRRDPEIDDIPEQRAPARPRLTPPPKPAPLPRTARRWSWLWILYVAVPISVWLRLGGGDTRWIFVASCLAIVPLASLIAQATEQIAARGGPMVGGLLNATFGNATEVIVAIVALNAGYVELVKASLAGSILSNLLLILGLALVAGGLRQPTLKFSKTAAGMSAAMVALAVAGLILPSLVNSTPGAHNVAQLSQVVAGILAATYVGSLLFTMHTHRRLFAGGDHAILDGKPWPLIAAIVALGLATTVVAVESEFLVDTIGSVTQSLHLSQLFLGLIVIPIVGNAAEHASAVVAARKGRTELAVQIAVGSATQVALLVAPLLVLVGVAIGQDMTLVFPLFQVIALGIAAIVSAIVTLDGESHWFEGMQLLALYAMIAAAAWFI